MSCSHVYSHLVPHRARDFAWTKYLDSDRTGTKKYFSCQFGLNPDISSTQNRVLYEAPNYDKRDYMTEERDAAALKRYSFVKKFEPQSTDLEKSMIWTIGKKKSGRKMIGNMFKHGFMTK